MDQSARIAAVVVFYNPDRSYVDNIRCYAGDVERVYVVDNSDVILPGLLAELADIPQVDYIPNAGNLGIATALNIGIKQAMDAGFDFVLTMDQDSTATPGMVKGLLDCYYASGGTSVGIVTPYHQLGDRSEPPSEDIQEVEVAMASGNLINCEVFKAAGMFRDDYFIDYVDHEYCLRLRQHGYRIVRANRAVLKHRLGAMTWHRILWKRVKVGNHPPVRRYYSYRNRFHLHRQYKDAFPTYFSSFYRNMVMEIIGLLLFERQKTAKLTMMLQGYRDYRRGVWGRYEERR